MPTVAGILMNSVSNCVSGAGGPGSVSQTPSISDGLNCTFTSQHVELHGVRLHGVLATSGEEP
jgi:hypothetical protein